MIYPVFSVLGLAVLSSGLRVIPFSSLHGKSPSFSSARQNADVPLLEEDIQGFNVEEDGVSKIVFVDISSLKSLGFIGTGDIPSSFFGKDATVTPFNDVEVDEFNAELIESQLNQAEDAATIEVSSFLASPSNKASPSETANRRINYEKPDDRIRLPAGISVINTKNPVRVSLKSESAPSSRKSSVISALIAPAQHTQLPSQPSPPVRKVDNSLESLRALKVAKRKSLNIF